MVSALKAYAGLLLVLLLFVSLALTTSLRAPLATGPDETAHFMFARFLAQHHYLPLTAADRAAAGYKSDQPPLNAALVAALYRGKLDAPPTVKLTHDSPRRQLAILDATEIPNWLALTTEDPWAGEIWLWRLGRLVSIAASALTLVVIYHTALLLYGPQPGRHLAATATVMSIAFIPTFVFISSVFSYENLLGLWLSLFLLTAVYLVERDNRPGWLYTLAGLWVGLAIVTKLSAITAPLYLAGLVLFIGGRAGWSPRRIAGRLALAAAGVLLGAGWWVLVIELTLNRVADLGWVAGLLHPILLADGSDQPSIEIANLLSGGVIGGSVDTFGQISWQEWLGRLFRSFWEYDWHFPALINYALLLTTALTVAGWGRGWRRSAQVRRWLPLLLAFVATFWLLPLVRFVIIRQTHAGMGQHILFPAASAFALLLTWGLGAWLPARRTWPWLGGIALGCAMLIWSIVQAMQIYQPPLPVRTAPPLQPATAEPLNLDFGPLALTGFSLAGLKAAAVCCETGQPALGVRLYGQAQDMSLENYQFQVQLVDAAGQPRAVWQGHPADGRYPTKAWEAGDVVRVETWLPLAGLPPARYTVQARIIGAGGPLSIEGQSTFALTDVAVTAPLAASAGAQVWQSGQPAQGQPRFNHRAAIQVTASAGSLLQLVGPGEAVFEPTTQAGATRVFVVNSRWPRGEYRVRQAGQDSVRPALWVNGYGRPAAPPLIESPLEANFADQLKLLGYNLPQPQLAPGDRLPITLYLQAIPSPPADFIMFTRLLASDGAAWGGYDRRPREIYSTLFWEANEVVSDSFSVPVDAAAPPGQYYLDVGFYLTVSESAVSLPLVVDGQMTDVTHISIGPITVTANHAD